ncbi:MAG TPA: PilZ domain-containing protein [Candidatus Didemnitutus sp.]|nr:PilZ domain-containing protein [Candidatus Didemnitutus sp.]
MPNPDPRADPSVERRKKPRHKINSNFRLKAVLALNSGAEPGSEGTWKDWPATLIDLSASGAHVQVNMAAVAFPEERCRLKLALGTFKLEIPGVVAHYICDTRAGACGVHFDFANEGVEKSFFRVLESVVVGVSLAPAANAASDPAGRHHELFTGKNFARLGVWRDAPGSPITGIEFWMNRYVVEAYRASDAGPYVRPSMRISGLTGDDSADGAGGVPLSAAQTAEARWQFSLIVSNMTKAIPEDVHRFVLPLATG